MADNKNNTYFPDYIVTPGEVLEDYIKYYKMTQAELSERTGLSKKTINEIIRGKAPITSKTALKFERTLGRPAHFWINLESDYQQDLERIAEKERLQKSLEWLKEFPVNTMIKFGWVKEKTIEALCRFFAIASPEQWQTIQYKYAVAYRKTQKKAHSSGALSAWLRKGELEAQKIHCNPFNNKSFKATLIEIRSLTTKKNNDFVQELVDLCAMSGVAVVFVPELPKTGVFGATRWLGEKPIIQLSLRYKSNDQFWFTFFHEAGHIIKHGRKQIFIEGDSAETEKENEANKFAKNLLIPKSDYTGFINQNNKFTEKSIIQFSAKLKISPGIVVGRLQHDKLIPFNRHNKLKIRYEWNDFEAAFS